MDQPQTSHYIYTMEGKRRPRGILQDPVLQDLVLQRSQCGGSNEKQMFLMMFSPPVGLNWIFWPIFFPFWSAGFYSASVLHAMTTNHKSRAIFAIRHLPILVRTPVRLPPH